MKKSTLLLLMLITALLTVQSQAKDSVLPPNVDQALIEDNLLVGLSTENTGLQRSCALMLGKIQSDRGVIPLLRTFHNNSDENVRIAAAWALCNIGDARGAYAVKRAAKHDESVRVRTVSAWYYENYVQNGSFTFTQPEYDMVTEIEDSVNEFLNR